MRVALLTDGIYPYVIGGMQKHSYYLCKYLAQQKVHVDLYHCNESKLDINKLENFTAEEKNYINSIVIGFPKTDKLPGHYLRASYKYSIAVFEKFKKQPPVDFVYAKGFAGWKLAEAKNKGWNGARFGVNFHGYEMFQPAPNFKAKLEQLFLFRGPVKYICDAANVVFSYGSKITDVIKSIPVKEEKIQAIATGIEKSWVVTEIKPTGDIKKLVFIGRYERRKGIQELSAALEKMPDHGFEFHFIGPIPEANKVKKSNVIYHGSKSNQEDIKAIVRTCDILVCPSYSEGMPNVIMEGMASGLAILATNVGAVNLMVGSDNGLLINLDELPVLDKKLNELILAPATTIDAYKNKSITKVNESFLWELIAEQHINLMQKYIVSKPAAMA
jgi:glycosyltransferase involved in cell wall biosynthesis